MACKKNCGTRRPGGRAFGGTARPAIRAFGAILSSPGWIAFGALPLVAFF
jgi:hypothetical protein